MEQIESARGSQHNVNIPHQQSRDVTRVVKILKQNEPLVRKVFWMYQNL